jgi:hypothetical protein
LIKRINKKVSPSGNRGILHDSRGDVRALSVLINELIDKSNELVDKVNELERQMKSKG